MANIIGLKEQETALREIEKILREMAVTNGFLDAQNPSGKYSITFTDEEGKKLKTDLSASKEEIDALVNRFKAETREYVLKLAQDNRIALEPKDLAILGLENKADDQQ